MLKRILITLFLTGPICLFQASVAEDSVSSRILGGSDTNDHDYFVTLLEKDEWGSGSDEYHYRAICGGVYLGDGNPDGLGDEDYGYVATAENCVDSFYYSSTTMLYLVVGNQSANMAYQICSSSDSCTTSDTNTSDDYTGYVVWAGDDESDIEAISSSNIIIYDVVNGTTGHELALIEVESSSQDTIELSSEDRFAALLSEDESDSLLAIGRGDTDASSSIYDASPDLQEVTLSPYVDTTCRTTSSSAYFCAGDDNENICIGDEGGPLLEDGTETLLGIAYSGYCSQSVGEYIDVYYYSDWIQEYAIVDDASTSSASLSGFESGYNPPSFDGLDSIGSGSLGFGLLLAPIVLLLYRRK